MDWTDDVIGRLKALWTEGHSTAEIGRRMGVSKNAVVGKAHRLALVARPSPIRRASPGEALKASPVRRLTGATLPPTPATRESEPLRVVPPPKAALVPHMAARTGRGRSVECCWPIGEPGTRSFHFCNAESLPGKPYCSSHASLAYVKVKDRREDAA